MEERALLDKALAGDVVATRSLVQKLLPIVQARVARTLVRRRGGSGRDVRQEVEDLAQEVFAALFENQGKILRAWDPERGLSLASFCGLVAEREAASILRSGRRSPWTEAATELDELERELDHAKGADAVLSSKEQLARLVERLRESLSPRGLELFHRLVVEEESVESVCKTTGMTADAVYAWRSRILKIVKALAREVSSSEPALVRRTPREETEAS